MSVKLIDLKKQYDEIETKLSQKIKEIFEKTNFIMGDETKSFEKELSEYLDVKHSISVGNGTDALVIALKALGIKEGDEVITSTYTFFATAEAIAFVGAVPVFVDIRLDTYNMDEDLIEAKITKKTKAIMPVHIFGCPAEMNKINEIAKKHNLFVIEDACQAIGSKYEDKMIGTLSDIACFSFFPTKNLGCAGDGGMIVTNSDDLAIKCSAIKAHGSGEKGLKAYNLINNLNLESEQKEEFKDNTVYNPTKYYNYLIGHNSRLDELQAAVLRLKLPLLEKWNSDRIKIAKKYNRELEYTGITKKLYPENLKHVFHLYSIETDKRDSLMNYLKEKDIATGVYYKVPLHRQKAFEDLKYKDEDFPNSEYLSNRILALPMYSGMSEEEQDEVIEAIKEWYEKNE